MASVQPRQPTQSELIVQQLAVSNPQLYQQAFGQTALFNPQSGLASSILSNPAYGGYTASQVKNLVGQSDPLFMQGLQSSPMAQELYAKSQQGLYLQQLQQQQIAQQQILLQQQGIAGGVAQPQALGANSFSTGASDISSVLQQLMGLMTALLGMLQNSGGIR